jgi:hypothetical protein
MEDLPLKDIHLPAAIGWWPPAPGWWLLLILLLVLPVAGYWLYRRLTRKTPLKSARKFLAELRLHAELDPVASLREVSALLRRVTISRDPRNQVAHLHGDAWLKFLDQGLADAPFSTGPGRCLADAHFQPNAPADLDLNVLFALCERWLQQQEKRRC